MTLRHHRHLPFGAELIAPDRTRFRLWAPSSRRVSLAIEGRDDIAMLAAGEGWFEVDADCGAGTRYRYRVVSEADDDVDGDATLVPDPASRAQAHDVHGPSVVIDPESYRWTHDDWRGRAWCETVIYEIHVGLAGGFDGVRGGVELFGGLHEFGRGAGVQALLVDDEDFAHHRVVRR